jgi:predicted porin
MNKFIWEPPAMGGLQLAINYVPDTEDQNTTGTTDADDVGDEEKDMMIALQYEATVGEAEFGIDVAYATADAEDRAVDVRIGKNIRWRVGGQVEVAGFQLGGFWKSFTEYAADTTQTEDRVNIGFNAEYETGPWTTGVSYRRATADEMSAGTATVKGTKTGEDKATQWNIGVTYELNDDMTLKAGYETQKWEDDANLATDENDAKSLDLKFEWDVWDGLEFDVGYQNFRYTHHDGLATSAKRSGHALTVFTEVTF